MTIDRVELRRLLEVITPEPWFKDNIEWGLSGEDAYFVAKIRSILPVLLDALEEEEAMTSALNGDVTELGQKLEAAEAREQKLLAAVKNIAKQMLHSEITDCDPDEIDWLSGYEGCVKEARSTLAEIAP